MDLRFSIIPYGGLIALVGLCILILVISHFVAFWDVFARRPQIFLDEEIEHRGRVFLAQELTSDFYTVYLIFVPKAGSPAVHILDPDSFKWHASSCKIAQEPQNDSFSVKGTYGEAWHVYYKSGVAIDPQGREGHPFQMDSWAAKLVIPAVKDRLATSGAELGNSGTKFREIQGHS